MIPKEKVEEILGFPLTNDLVNAIRQRLDQYQRGWQVHEYGDTNETHLRFTRK